MIIDHAQRWILNAATTIYEAQISTCSKMGGLQRKKALAKHAVDFAAATNKASPSDCLHPALAELARAAAASATAMSKAT